MNGMEATATDNDSYFDMSNIDFSRPKKYKPHPKKIRYPIFVGPTKIAMLNTLNRVKADGIK